MMPFGDVVLKPGVNVELTPTANSAGYASSSLIRYKAGMAQKIGGWTKFYSFTVGGVPRDMRPWQTINGDKYLSVGSTTSLGVINEAGVLTAITPTIYETDVVLTFDTTAGSATINIHDTSLTAPVTTYDAVLILTPWSAGAAPILAGIFPIESVTGVNSYEITAAGSATTTLTGTLGGGVTVTTTLGSAIVSVALNSHGMSAGDTFVFPFDVVCGGVTLNGVYTVNTVPTINTFTIAASSIATATVSVPMVAGAKARLIYYVTPGPVPPGAGYSLGGYSLGGYSLGEGAASYQTGSPITSTDWTQDNWGSTLLSCPDGGAIYEWTPGTGFGNAKLVPNAPVYNGGIFIATPAQILLAWGSTAQQTIGINQDPLLYSWSDQLDYTFWTPGVVNPATGNLSQAGSQRIPTGSRIVAGLAASQQALLWTDLDLWSISYIGAPLQQGLIFGQTKIASSCGAIGSHAVGQLGSSVYWMGQSNFFTLGSGGVVPMPCSVWDAVFQDLDTDNAWKVRCCPNTPFNEVMWQFPSLSGGTGENDTYVKVNLLEGSGEPAWDIGQLNAMPRSAWVDQNVFGPPLGASPTGSIYSQETGENADGAPIQWSFTTGYWVIGDAEQVAFVDRVIPDFKFGTYNGSDGAVIQITLRSVMYPGDTPREYGPYTFSSTTQYLNPRLRGRQMSIEVSGSDLNSFARLGRIRFRWAPDGRY